MNKSMQARLEALEQANGDKYSKEIFRRMMDLQKDSAPFLPSVPHGHPDRIRQYQEWTTNEASKILAVVEKEFPGQVKPNTREQAELMLQVGLNTR